MYKVFVNKSLIVLTDKTDKEVARNTSVIPFIDGNQLKELVTNLENNKPKVIIKVTHFDIDELWNAFINQFKYVQAAGGLVINTDGDFLMIHRNGRWDLPKGHLKKGERPEFGGMREVTEECGVEHLEIKKHLDNTFHMYERNGMVLKKTFWYIMTAPNKEVLIPQEEEGIDIVDWKNNTDIKEMMKKSYPIIARLLKKGLK
jgi:8-oxo-dGTP pyrophosphatase MutT (NUDIX family)